MSDEQPTDFGDGDKRGGKKRRSKKKKQRKPIAEINFGNGVTAAAASNTVAMEVDSSQHRHGDDPVVATTFTRRSDEDDDDDGSPATKKVVHSVEIGDDGEVVEITETTTIKREGGHHHGENGADQTEDVRVDDLAEGESTLLVDVEQDGNVHTETTTELDSGPVTVEHYEEKLDDDTTVQVEHVSQTLTTTKTIVITEDGREVEVDADDPNIQYIEEEPEVITEEITQTIRRRRIITKTPDGREIETFEDVVVSDEDAEEVTTVTVTHDDAPTEGHTLPMCHVTIGAAPEADQAAVHTEINHDVHHDVVTHTHEQDATVPGDEEETVQMFVESRVESGQSLEDLLGPTIDNGHEDVPFAHVEHDARSSSEEDEPAVHVELPPRDLVEEEDIGCSHVKDEHVVHATAPDADDDRPRSTSQRTSKFIIAAPHVERSPVKIYIRAEESTPDDDDRHATSKRDVVQVNARPSPPCKEELIEKHSFGARDGIDEWVLVNFKHDEVLTFIELLKKLPFSYDMSTEVPQSQCSCW